ncbi:MAG: hypothetical protein COA49_05900 [Bacteroidetes bacterium]|nr:MAG: hypothetical protein COA49_05900 [Bacteroidota bacterium]
MKNHIILILILFVTTSVKGQVSPEIELGAKGVMSGNFEIKDNNSTSAVSDFSDSQILLGFRQKLYNNWRAQMVFGMQFPDADSDLGQVFYNHVFLKLENQKNIVKVGRSTTQTIINEFSTLRDDDAMQFNYSLNPFSNGVNTQDNQYGNVIEYTHIFKQRVWLTFHGENFADLSAPDNFELNSFGGSLIYIIPESQIWNRNIIQRVGLSYNNYITNRPGGELLKNILGTITLNLKPDPVHFIDLKVQGIYNVGFTSIDSINSYSNYVNIGSFSTFGTIRYVYRKYERPMIQTSLGFGYKTFNNVTESEQIIGIANVFYRIGENFDLGFQYRYLKNNGQSGVLFGQQEHRVQIAMVYTINQIFNNQFDTRNSILNLEHSYLK